MRGTCPSKWFKYYYKCSYMRSICAYFINRPYHEVVYRCMTSLTVLQHYKLEIMKVLIGNIVITCSVESNAIIMCGIFWFYPFSFMYSSFDTQISMWYLVMFCFQHKLVFKKLFYIFSVYFNEFWTTENINFSFINHKMYL